MKYLQLLTLIFFSFFRSYSQVDTSFWFVAPDISSGLGQSPITLNISSYTTSATVLIRQPANPTFTPITVSLAASSTASVDLSTFIAAIENNTANAVLNRGIYISSTSNISVNYCIGASANKEMISLKGRKGLGNDFYTPFQNQWQSSSGTVPKSFSAIDIVASKNNTKVAITPRANIIGHTKDITFTITLQAGETFSCRDTSTTAPTKLAGSIISSDSLVAITVSSHGLVNSGCNSTVADQITTSQYAGTEFAIHKGLAASDKVFILATVNNTSITVNDGFTTTGTLINTGQTFSVAISQPLVNIKCTQPSYAFHVSAYGCKLSGAQVPNIYCQGSYTTAFTRTTNDSFAVNLYTRNGYEGFFQLNGSAALLPASSFSPVPGTSGNIVAGRFYFTTSQVPVGSYNTIINSKDIFGCGIHYGSASAGSGFAYISEFDASPFTIAGPTGTICSNTTYSLNGLIGGGNVNGTWSTSGFGSFLNAATSLTNTYIPSNSDTTVANTPVKLILTSTGPCPSRTDTIKLTVKKSPIVTAPSDQLICGNNATITLNGNVGGPTTTGVWSSTGTGSFVPNTTTLTTKYIASNADTSAGFVKLILTSTGNGICNAETDTVLVTFTDPPKVNAGPAVLSKCINNASVALTGTVSGSSITGKWTSSGSGLFSPNNVQLNSTYIPSSGDLAGGTINIYLSSTNNGNCLPVIDTLKVNFTPAPNVNAGPDLNICKNNSIAALNGLISGGSTKGQWSGGAGIFTPNDSLLTAGYNPAAGDISAGFVILTLTSTNNGNCAAVSDQVRIDYRDEPIANFSSNTVCQNQSTQFTDFSNPSLPAGLASWEWQFGDGSNSTLANPVHTYSAAGTYSAQLVVKNTFNCYDTISKTITVYNLPNTNFTFTRTCSGSALQMNFKDSTTIASPDTIATYFWDYGGLGTSTTQNPSQVYPYPGVFNITHIVTSTKGCTDTIVKTVTVTPQPVAKFDFQNNSGFNIGTNVAFIDSSKNAVTWFWDFNDGSSSTVQNPNHVYYNNGTFTVMQVVSDQFGCTDTARLSLKILTVVNDITELIPNVISPNGDGLNDIWRLDFIDIYYPKAEIEIYNRWGQKLFQSTGYSNAWDGTYKGDALPVGTYFFIIDLKDPDKPDLYKGTILLMK